MTNEYTNEQILFTFREELLRRKKLIDGLKNYIQYDNSKYLVKICGWMVFKDKEEMILQFLKKKKRILNIIWNFLQLDYKPENECKIGNFLRKENLTEFFTITDENGLRDYLLFLYEELGKSLTLDKTICSIYSIFELNSNLYSISYTIWYDFISIINLEDKRNIDLNLLQNYLNQTQNSELFPEYIVRLLEKNSDKKIIFDENKEIIRKKRITYKIEDKNDSLILKRKLRNTK